MSENETPVRHCTECGKVVESAAAKFCQHCGTPVVRRPAEQSDWSQPLEGLGCVSKLLALCAILCGLSSFVLLVIAPLVFVRRLGQGLVAFGALILSMGLTIVFVRVRELALKDEPTKGP